MIFFEKDQQNLYYDTDLQENCCMYNFEMLRTANKMDMDCISSYVTEGQIYDVFGFIVKAAAPTYQAIAWMNYIKFYEGTELINQCSINIPLHRFSTAASQSILLMLGSLGTLVGNTQPKYVQN